MAGKLGDLPAGFDPEAHVRLGLARGVKKESLAEGVTLLHHDPKSGIYELAKRAGATIRCWQLVRLLSGRVSLGCCRSDFPETPDSLIVRL